MGTLKKMAREPRLESPSKPQRDVGEVGDSPALNTTSPVDSDKATQLLRVLLDSVNRNILVSLMGSASYTRELASRLGIRESHLSTRLKNLERLKLVSGS
jgi:DNA-binding HxlR family transcriptional regulator